MKIANKYIKRLSLLALMALMVVSCTEFAEFESTSYGPGPSISLALVSTQDSTFTVSVTSDADGYASIILLPGAGNAVPGDPEDLLTGNIASMEYQSKKVRASQPTEFTFQGLVQYALYEVQAAANNGDGKPSEVSALAVGTDDTHAPVLSGTSPAVGYDPVLAVDGSVVLVFDEPVKYDDTKVLTFSEFYMGEDVAASSVTVDYNVVTVTPGRELTNRDYLLLSYPEGAFTDYADNLSAAVESGLDAEAGALYGLFWRVEMKEFEALSVTPEEESVTPDAFEIVVTFDEEVDVENYVDGDITLTYDNGLDILIKSVLASQITADGNELTIMQSYTPQAGMVVTLDIPAESIEVGIGNPNAGVSASWDITHPLQTWLGDYTVEAVSYADPGNWDEAWNVSIGSYAGDLNMLAITIDAGEGGGVPFLASIDTVAMTISIDPATEVGDIYGYGSTTVYVGDYATLDETATIVGTIEEDGTIKIDELTMILTDYGFVDGLWDAFNTTWSPAGKKSAAGVNAYASKAARFK